MEKIVIGLIEKIWINGEEVLAKIDTGAAKNSIDIKLASKLRLGPIVKIVKIVSSQGKERRPVVKAEIDIKGKKIETSFNVTDRSNVKCPVLIGQEVLKQGFLIDPGKDETSNNWIKE